MDRQKLLRILSFMIVTLLVVSVALNAFAKYDTIPYGEQSDRVRTMQSALKKKGYYRGSVDGKFGPSTKSAVYRYQASIGLKADGKPGDRTLTALLDGGSTAINTTKNSEKNAFVPKDPRSLYYGCTGPRVTNLQRALAAAGYFKGTVDGKYGDMTELAVRKFQTKRGLHVDGVVGRKTLASLNKAQSKVRLGTAFVLAIGSKGSEVKALQAKLVREGYDVWITGTMDKHGYFGEATKEMVLAWQENTGKSMTGTVKEKDYNAYVLGL